MVIQAIYFVVKFTGVSNAYNEEASLEVNGFIDSLILKEQQKKYTIQPFNPNYITDAKGYTLGMSVEEIDRLLSFRESNSFVNSAKEFQEVTQVSNKWLDSISPYFKFPEWTQKKSALSTKETNTIVLDFSESNEKKMDINQASEEDLIAVKGIGKVLAERIITYRVKLHGFSLDDQLYEVWGIDEPTISKVLETFTVISSPAIEKVNLNTISLKRLTENPYLTYKTAKSILKFRSSHGNITTFEELLNAQIITEKQFSRLPLYFYLTN
ncbi:hypothetical protein Y10_32980 [Neptunitalea sp. Y10]|uniref:Uncharacterized protein n=1 Tax=Neptunitalea lumnitzerae TaxID=2965509 RepID=A0ABQ5MP93_9FLAO|nr:hypothetical protein Y10_32980 [Neptunitalea sp. Y10]